MTVCAALYHCYEDDQGGRAHLDMGLPDLDLDEEGDPQRASLVDPDGPRFEVHGRLEVEDVDVPGVPVRRAIPVRLVILQEVDSDRTHW